MADASSTGVEGETPTIGLALGGGIVTVEIGVDRRKYYIHKALLVHHSEYFMGALCGDWKEANEGIVTIDDVVPAALNIFVHWLYAQRVPESYAYHEWQIVMETPSSYLMDDNKTQPQAYILGDRFLAPTFRRAMNAVIVDNVTDIWKWSPGTYLDLVVWAFEQIPPQRPVLQLLANSFCDDWEDKLHEKGDTEVKGTSSKVSGTCNKALLPTREAQRSASRRRRLLLSRTYGWHAQVMYRSTYGLQRGT